MRAERERVAGEFVGTGNTSMVCNLNSAVPRDAATGFVVRNQADAVVVTSRF